MGKRIVFENGKRIEIDRQIAEGGFSVVYSAIGYNGDSKQYAVKQVLCPEKAFVQTCRAEVAMHRLFRHPNLMPILGMKMDTNGHYGEFKGTVCYMLFPFLGSSLRGQITKRRLLHEDAPQGIRPWSEREIIEIFAGIVDGVKEMQDRGYAHRDIKLENVLLDEMSKPVLMDFGSAGPVQTPIPTRTALMEAIDDAATNCTMSYKAPELFEGGARYGESDLDGRVDVWSLGCVLFGMMYGASPFESEFRGERVQIVDCSYLRVLGRIPTPSPETELGRRYKPELMQAVRWMLNQDRAKRPTIREVAHRVDELLRLFQGRRPWLDGKVSSFDIDVNESDDDDFESLLTKNDNLV